MKKICEVCNDDFVGHFNRKYCSSQCKEVARIGVLLPDPKKKYKYYIPSSQGQKQSWKW